MDSTKVNYESLQEIFQRLLLNGNFEMCLQDGLCFGHSTYKGIRLFRCMGCLNISDLHGMKWNTSEGP
jgi:hypothetical protein